MEDVYSHLSKLNSLISSIKNSKVHALQALPPPTDASALNPDRLRHTSKPVQKHVPRTQAKKRYAAPLLRKSEETKPSTKLPHQTNTESTASCVLDSQTSTLSPAVKSRSKHIQQPQPQPQPRQQSQPKPRLKRKQKQERKPKQSIIETHDGKRSDKQRTAPKPQPNDGCRERIVKGHLQAIVPARKRTPMLKHELVQEQVKSSRIPPRVDMAEVVAVEHRKHSEAPTGTAYMLVPSKHRYIVVKGSRFLRCSEDYSPELATPRREVYVSGNACSVRSQQPSTIELEQPISGKIQSSYDGKSTVYFKVLLDALSSSCIHYCRMHGSGKIYNGGVDDIDEKEVKRRRRQDRKLMLLEERMAIDSRNLQIKKESRRKQVEAAQKTTKRRLKVKIQRAKLEELQKEQREEELKRSKLEEKRQSVALAKELMKKSQLRVKEYLKRTTPSTSLNDTKPGKRAEGIEAMKSSQNGNDYRTIVIKRLRKARAEQHRKMLELGVPADNNAKPQGNTTSIVTSPRPHTKGSRAYGRITNDKPQSNETAGHAAPAREAPTLVEAEAQRHHRTRAPKVRLQRASDTEAFVGFRIVDI